MNKILLAVSGGQRFASHIDFARAHDSHGDEYSPPPPPHGVGHRGYGEDADAARCLIMALSTYRPRPIVRRMLLPLASLRASVSRLTADFGGR